MIESPPDIAAIFTKPGRTWTDGETTRVVEWLNSEPQLTRLHLLASRHLGTEAVWQDSHEPLTDSAKSFLTRLEGERALKMKFFGGAGSETALNRRRRHFSRG